MADARLIAVADAVRAAIAAGLPAGDTTEVTRCYVPRVTPDQAEGRFVFVYPLGYADAGPATRGDQTYAYRVGVQVDERYREAGDPPDEWLDAQLLWCETQVFDLLSDARAAYLLNDTLRPEEAEVVVAYDPEQLDRKLFESVMVFTFRAEEAG